MCGDLSFAYPLEQCARLHLQVLRGLNCGKPFCFHVSLFSHSGNAGRRRLRGRLSRVLSRKRTRFLHMVAAIISADLLKNVPRTLPEPPIHLCRAPRCCRWPTRTALHVTKKTLAIPCSLVTALRPVSSGIAHALLQRLVAPPYPYWRLLLERVPLATPGSSGRWKGRGL